MPRSPVAVIPQHLFRSAVAAYARFRTGYPPENVAALAHRLGLDRTQAVIDIGCGTGQLAIPLAQHARSVIAIDPLDEMLALGRGAALASNTSNITWLRGDSNNLDRLIEFRVHVATIRRAAQVVSGIGFIGGGAILKEGSSFRGLTTAAGLWAAASLGMEAGAGLYVIGALGTVIILLTLVVLRHLEYYLPQRVAEIWSIEITLDHQNSLQGVERVLNTQCRATTLEGYSVDEEKHAIFSVDMSRGWNIEQIRAVGARGVVWHAHESGNTESGA